MKNFKFAGTISHGTMRSEDLIPVFRNTLRELIENANKSLHQDSLCSQAKKVINGSVLRETTMGDEYWNSQEANYDLEELFDLLGEFAPENFYFGAHEGDGSDYGFWEIQD